MPSAPSDPGAARPNHQEFPMDEIRSILLHLDASTGATRRLRAAHRLAATAIREVWVYPKR